MRSTGALYPQFRSAQRREIVGIEHQHLIQSNIGYIKEAILVIDRHPAGVTNPE
jgi:hypothetical protein